MLNSNRKPGGFAGKLLLSSALVAVSLVYGWWQQHDTGEAVLAMAPVPLPRLPSKPAPVGERSVVATPAPAAQPVISGPNPAPKVGATPSQDTATPRPEKSFAMAAPQKSAPSIAPAAPETPPPQNVEASSPPPSSLTAQQALQMNVPTDGASPPLPLVTGSPEPGTMASVPAGGHLEDGDYVSSKHQLMWGELRIKISVHGGQITGVQALQFPDHRSQSLYLSQMAIPILGSEVIKSQKPQVDVVSSATDTSYTFQDAVADAIIKATRG